MGNENTHFLSQMLLVGLGGTIGGLARMILTMGQTNIWWIAGINIAGTCLLTVLQQMTQRRQMANYWHPFLGTGVLGGFTTFSALMVVLYTVYLPIAVVYLAITLLGGMLSMALVKRWLPA